MDIQHFLAVNMMVYLGARPSLDACCRRPPRQPAVAGPVNGLILAGGRGPAAWSPGTAGTLRHAGVRAVRARPARRSARKCAQCAHSAGCGEAARIARAISWLHPAADSRFNAAMVAAQAAASPSEQSAALARARRRSAPSEQAHHRRPLCLRIDRRLGGPPRTCSTPSRPRRDDGRRLKIRALGETRPASTEMTRSTRTPSAPHRRRSLRKPSYSCSLRRPARGGRAACSTAARRARSPTAKPTGRPSPSAGRGEPRAVGLGAGPGQTGRAAATPCATRDAAPTGTGGQHRRDWPPAPPRRGLAVIVEHAAQRLRRTPAVSDARVALHACDLGAAGGHRRRLCARRRCAAAREPARPGRSRRAVAALCVASAASGGGSAPRCSCIAGLLHVGGQQPDAVRAGPRLRARLSARCAWLVIYVLGGLASSAFVLWLAA